MNEAISTLKDELRKGYREGVVEEVADEWGIKPQLLNRKFEEATGKSPSQWLPPTDTRELFRQRAFRVAKDEIGRHRRARSQVETDLVPGKLYQLEGQDIEWFFVGVLRWVRNSTRYRQKKLKEENAEARIAEYTVSIARVFDGTESKDVIIGEYEVDASGLQDFQKRATPVDWQPPE